MFVCLEFFIPLKSCSLIRIRHYLLGTHCNWTLSVPNPLGHPFTLSSAITRDTHTCCRAFGSGTGSDCLNNSCLYRRWIEWRVTSFSKMFKRWYTCSENTLTTLNNRFFQNDFIKFSANLTQSNICLRKLILKQIRPNDLHNILSKLVTTWLNENHV